MKKGRGGIEFTDERVGTGAEANRRSVVKARVTCTLRRGDPVPLQPDSSDGLWTFDLRHRFVIPGLQYGFDGMRVGGVRRLIVPPHLAYGKDGVPGAIPPDAILVFAVELVSVEVQDGDL